MPEPTTEWESQRKLIERSLRQPHSASVYRMDIRACLNRIDDLEATFKEVSKQLAEVKEMLR